jgi:hypothetical protein
MFRLTRDQCGVDPPWQFTKVLAENLFHGNIVARIVQRFFDIGEFLFCLRLIVERRYRERKVDRVHERAQNLSGRGAVGFPNVVH